MKQSTRDTTKQRKPRAPVTGDPVMVRVQPNMAMRLDDWRRRQDDAPGRPEAIRRLVEIGLSKPSNRPRILSTSKQSAPRAAELAAKTIDKHLDPQAPPGEREVRKRKLIEGPSVFRGTRRDRPKK
jgi:hypothetical protein